MNENEKDDVIEGLRQALQASPSNERLLLLLICELHKRGRDDEAAVLLDPSKKELLNSASDQIMAAQVFLNLGSPAQALDFLQGDDPEVVLLMSRAYYQLDRMEEAKDAYRRAVEANSTLEDQDFALVLGIHPSAGKERESAQDSTDEYEVNRVFQPPEKTITFSDVGGLDWVKKQIRRKIITPFQKPSLFKRFRKSSGGGILLYGPPGCGKTLMARATAGECGARFFNVEISDVLNMYIGESEQRLHAIFDKARESAPSVLFFDEVEALAGKRQFTREATSSKLVSQFLSELDGFAQNNTGVLVLAATNVPWSLDPAFRRPGRFDRVLFIPPPDKPAREEILTGLLHDRPGGSDLSVSSLAERTSGFSGADLKLLIDEAVDEAIDSSIESGVECDLHKEHLFEALKGVKPTTGEWLTSARNYARYANETGLYDDVLDFLKKHSKS